MFKEITMSYRCWYTVAARTAHYLQLKEQRHSITEEERIKLQQLRKKLHDMFHRMRA